MEADAFPLLDRLVGASDANWQAVCVALALKKSFR